MGCSNSTQAQIKGAAEKAKAEHDKKNAPQNGVTGDAFTAGQALKRGEEAFSADGRYKVVHQNDGNVVLYHVKSGQPKWATNTDGKETTQFVFQGDGNLVLYNNETALWASNTEGKNGTKVVIQNDGNVVVYTAEGAPVWATNTCVQVTDTLPVDGKLWVDDVLVSADGRYKLITQADGNVVLYHVKSGEPKWATNTNGKPATHLILQGDGNLVLYNGADPVWASNTVGSGAARLLVQNDGNVVLYTADGAAPWASNTCVQVTDTLPVDGKLWVDDVIVSADGRFKLITQADGNLVLYGPSGAKWASNTNGKPATHLILQGDGNLVLYNGADPVWASNTVGSGAARLLVQNDGNLVLYTADGAAPWASNTNE